MIEIMELVVKANMVEVEQKNASENTSESMSSQTSSTANATLVEDCVRQVLDILERKEDR